MAETERMRHMLTKTKTIAVVGLSPDPQRDSQTVAAYLKDRGYRIVPVNPKIGEVLGERRYPSLSDIPEPIDTVLIFRRSEHVPSVVQQAIAIGGGAEWKQIGIADQEAAQRAQAAGLEVVMNAWLRLARRAFVGRIGRG